MKSNNDEKLDIRTVLQELEKRKRRLTSLIRAKEQALKKAPSGALRICNRGNSYEYYHYDRSAEKENKYINKANMKLAYALAQKGYDRDVLKCLKEEREVIEVFLKSYPELNMEELYTTMKEPRRALIKPIVETDEMYRERWLAETYQKKPFSANTPAYFTDKEEKVRSKSEVFIANLLNKAGVPYRYECSLYIEGYGSVFPDFTCLNVRKRRCYYWEHLGMMENPEYASKAIKKISGYNRNNIFEGENLILSYESITTPIDQNDIQDFRASDSRDLSRGRRRFFLGCAYQNR